jgi:hypothetical protein
LGARIGAGSPLSIGLKDGSLYLFELLEKIERLKGFFVRVKKSFS